MVPFTWWHYRCGILYLSDRVFQMLVYLIPTIIAFVFLLLNILAGLKLIRNPDSKQAIRFSIFVLLLQLIQVFIFGITYFNYFGPYLAIGFADTPNFEFYFRTGVEVYFFRNGFEKGHSDIMVLINLVPLLLIYLLDSQEKKTAKRQAGYESIYFIKPVTVLASKASLISTSYLRRLPKKTLQTLKRSTCSIRRRVN